MTDLLQRARAYLELAEKATPGPWELAHDDTFVDGPCEHQGICDPSWIVQTPEETLEAEPACALNQLRENNRFIAASHEAAAIIRELLAERPKHITSLPATIQQGETFTMEHTFVAPYDEPADAAPSAVDPAALPSHETLREAVEECRDAIYDALQSDMVFTGIDNAFGRLCASLLSQDRPPPDWLNRRAQVEQEMWNCYHGKTPMPDKQKLSDWARTLGIPTEYRT